VTENGMLNFELSDGSTPLEQWTRSKMAHRIVRRNS